MAQGSESDYRLLLSFIALTRFVLNSRNNDLKCIGHAIAFALHPTDWKSRKVYSSRHSRFIQHGLDKIKYPGLPNEIPGIQDKLHYKINLFVLMMPLDISDMLRIFQNAFTLKKSILLFFGTGDMLG